MHVVCSFAQFSVKVHAHGICTLVRCGNAHSGFENIYVALGKIIGCRAVYKNRVEGLCFLYKVKDFVKICAPSAGLYLVPPVFEVYSFGIKKHSVKVCYGHYANVNSLVKKGLLLLADLIKHCSADCSGSKGKNLNRLNRIEEKLVCYAYCSVTVVRIDYCRNRALAGTLCNGKNIYITAGKCVKECSCNTPLLLHCITYN